MLRLKSVKEELTMPDEKYQLNEEIIRVCSAVKVVSAHDKSDTDFLIKIFDSTGEFIYAALRNVCSLILS